MYRTAEIGPAKRKHTVPQQTRAAAAHLALYSTDMVLRPNFINICPQVQRLLKRECIHGEDREKGVRRKTW
jgi:hypothetical protein